MSFLPEASFGLGVLSLPASVRPSVRPWSVTNFVRAITHYPFKLGSPNLDHRCYYPWQKWCPCKRSRSEVKGQGHSGQNPICPFPDCNSKFKLEFIIGYQMMHKAWMGIEEVPYCLSRSYVIFQGHRRQIIVIWVWAFPDCNSNLNPPMTMKIR